MKWKIKIVTNCQINKIMEKDILERLIILLDDIEETTDISGMINSKDLLFEIKDKYNELKKRELARTFPPNLK